MLKIGLEVPASDDRALDGRRRTIAMERLGLPLIIQAVAHAGRYRRFDRARSRRSSVSRSRWGLEMSPIHEVLIEESVEGWKEFELEVMRDRPTTS